MNSTTTNEKEWPRTCQKADLFKFLYPISDDEIKADLAPIISRNRNISLKEATYKRRIRRNECKAMLIVHGHIAHDEDDKDMARLLPDYYNKN